MFAKYLFATFLRTEFLVSDIFYILYLYIWDELKLLFGGKTFLGIICSAWIVFRFIITVDVISVDTIRSVVMRFGQHVIYSGASLRWWRRHWTAGATCMQRCRFPRNNACARYFVAQAGLTSWSHCRARGKGVGRPCACKQQTMLPTCSTNRAATAGGRSLHATP